MWTLHPEMVKLIFAVGAYKLSSVKRSLISASEK